MKTIEPRRIENAEADLVRRVLVSAPLMPIPESILNGIAALEVVGVCSCGCATRYFRPEERDQHRVADAVAHFDDGRLANLVVWADAEQVTTLEVVDHFGVGDLPLAESVCTWEEEGARQAKM